MPLPSGGKVAWPPESAQPAYAAYREWDAWYSGDAERLARVYGGRRQPSAGKQPWWRFWSRQGSTGSAAPPRTQLHVPLAGDVAATSANLLFAEAPTIQVAEAHAEQASADARAAQDRLTALVAETGLLNRWLEAAETAAALGGVYLKPAWDREVADGPLVSVVQADAAVPEFRLGMLSAATLWRVVEDDGRTVWRHLERHEPGVILHGLYRGGPSELGEPVSLATHPVTAEFEPVVTLPFDTLGLRYVPNTRPYRRQRGSPLGQSDYAGAEGLLDALDETWTSWMRDIRLGKARILVPEEYLTRSGTGAAGAFGFDVDQEVFAPLEMPPDQAGGSQITLSQFVIRTDEHARTAAELVDRIVTTAGYSPQTFGLRIEGRAESGTALRLRERKSFITQQKKRRYWQAPLADTLEMLLRIDAAVFGRRVVPFRPRVELADSITPDPAETAATVELLYRAQAVSAETRVRMAHPDWPREEVAAEVQRILDEQGLAVPDPMQAGALP